MIGMMELSTQPSQSSMETDNNKLSTNYGNIKVVYLRSRPIAYLGPGFFQFFCSLGFSMLLMAALEYFTLCSDLFRIIGVTLKLALFSTLLLVGISNPGIQLVDFSELNPAIGRYCGVCKIQGRAGTRHCKECNTCISEYDHHCPFFGACIGRGNILYFKATMLLLGANMVIAILANVLGRGQS